MGLSGPIVFHYSSFRYCYFSFQSITLLAPVRNKLPHHNQAKSKREYTAVHFCDAYRTNLVRKDCSILSISSHRYCAAHLKPHQFAISVLNSRQYYLWHSLCFTCFKKGKCFKKSNCFKKSQCFVEDKYFVADINST